METEFQKVPSELTTLNQWVAYTLPRKIPFNVKTGTAASSTNPSTWASFDDAVGCVSSGSEYDGIGFVFSADDHYVGVDLDACRDTISGELSPWAKRIVEELDSYTEVSPSGTGVKIWCKGESPYEGGKNIKVDAPILSVCDKKPAIEIYDHKRYFTVTGKRLAGKAAIKSVQPETIRDIVDRVALEKVVEKVPQRNQKQASSHEQDDLVRRARAYIAKMPPAIDGQGGSRQTLAVACTLVRFDLDRNNVCLLLNEYNDRCIGHWSEKELVRKVDEAFKLDDGDRSLRDWRPETDLPQSINGESPKAAAASNEVAKKPPRSTPLHKVGLEWLKAHEAGEKPKYYENTIGVPFGPEQVLLLGGAPGSGKTTLGLQLLLDALLNDDNLRAVVANVEMSHSNLFDRLISLHSGLSYSQVRERTAADLTAAANNLIGCVDDRLTFLNEPYAIENLNHVALEHHANLVLIDYCQRFLADSKVEKRPNVEMVIANSQTLAKSHGMAVINISSLNRDRQAGPQARFRETAEFEFACTNGYIIDRDQDEITLRHVKARETEEIDILLKQTVDLRFRLNNHVVAFDDWGSES